MGLQAYLAGLSLSASEQMIQRLHRDFFPLNEEQTWQPLGLPGWALAGAIFRRAVFMAGWLNVTDHIPVPATAA